MIGVAQSARLAQHAGRDVDAVNMPGRPDRFLQVGKIHAGAATDVEHAAAALEFHMRDRATAQTGPQKKQPIKKRDKFGDAVVASADKITFAVHPLIRHDVAPRHTHSAFGAGCGQVSAAEATHKYQASGFTI
jgi:hypothetical protein